jgi:FkbM family methyltransferase
MISFAQNGEDVLLRRLFPEGTGFYIDVGAHDPLHDSVTKHFYDRGWHGINIEPGPAAFHRLRAVRDRDINLHLGISDREGRQTFYEARSAGGCSTFEASAAENLRHRGLEIIERSVPVTTLASICQRYVPPSRAIDFLKIDAEFSERNVLAGGDWDRWRPRVVLIEVNEWQEWEPLLLAANYLFAIFDGINRFYVRAEDAHFLPRLRTQANYTDDFLPYGYFGQIANLPARLARSEDLGPRAWVVVAVARMLWGASARFPWLASLVKRAIRLAG